MKTLYNRDMVAFVHAWTYRRLGCASSTLGPEKSRQDPRQACDHGKAFSLEYLLALHRL